MEIRDYQILGVQGKRYHLIKVGSDWYHPIPNKVFRVQPFVETGDILATPVREPEILQALDEQNKMKKILDKIFG